MCVVMYTLSKSFWIACYLQNEFFFSEVFFDLLANFRKSNHSIHSNHFSPLNQNVHYDWLVCVCKRYIFTDFEIDPLGSVLVFSLQSNSPIKICKLRLRKSVFFRTLLASSNSISLSLTLPSIPFCKIFINSSTMTINSQLVFLPSEYQIAALCTKSAWCSHL